MPNHADQLRAIRKAFTTRPLSEKNTRLYVDFDRVRGSGTSARTLLESHIRLAGLTPTAQMLYGHGGSGKSTELYRLKQRLQTSTPRYFVVVVNADDRGGDLQHMEFPDLLILILRQLLKQLRKLDIELIDTLRPTLAEAARNLFSQLRIKSFDIDALIGKLTIELKGGSPNTKDHIRKELDAHNAEWIHALNEVIREARPGLIDQQYSDVVLLIDGLDHALGQHSSVESLLLDRSTQLTSLACHLVVTVPIHLVYSPKFALIVDTFGGAPRSVPMVKLAERPPQRLPFQDGLDKMRELVDRRISALARIGLKPRDVFASEEMIAHAIRQSAGVPRDLVKLVVQALAAALGKPEPLPMDMDCLNNAISSQRKTMKLQLVEEHWPVLHQVQRTAMLRRASETRVIEQELLTMRAILMYCDYENDVWYDVNPLIRDAAELGILAGSTR